MTYDCWFVEPLLNWWVKTGPREYPWRKTNNLFHAVVAEVLLQRTRRDAVLKVYDEFVKRYPTAEDFLKADRNELENLLRPLGLVKRVNYLIGLARAFKENTPQSFDDLRGLPGVGEYTASIVAAVHLGQHAVGVDKNVARIMMRLFGLNPRKRDRPQDDPVIREIVKKCAPRDRIKEYNLALLDLGWEICCPRNPKCEICPLREGCLSLTKRTKRSACRTREESI